MPIAFLSCTTDLGGGVEGKEVGCSRGGKGWMGKEGGRRSYNEVYRQGGGGGQG
jgi:hypothetical protein